MLTKTQLAFLQSAQALRNTTGKLYLWTFTFEKVYPAWHYQDLWHRFQKDLQHCGTSMFYGLRVVQMHESHGFHYHCLFNEYVDARRVWRIARKHGMGHIDVKKVKSGDGAINYVMRYLTSDAQPFPIRLRRWGGMFGFPCQSVNDLRFVHPASDTVTYCTRFWGRGTFGKDTISAIYNSPNCQTGDYRALMCALSYREHKVLSSFNWTDDEISFAQTQKPFSDWISKDDTLWETGFMPSLLKRDESLYWRENKVEKESCNVAIWC